MKKEHGLYKYVCGGEIIYIGKSNSNIRNRIAAHKKESKFKPYLAKGCEIYICEFANSTETDIAERVLINQYKPILNGTDNTPGYSGLITIQEPNWIDYDNYIKKKPSISHTLKKKSQNNDDIYLGGILGKKVWLDNEYDKKVKGRKTKVLLYDNKNQAFEYMSLLVRASLTHGKHIGSVIRIDNIDDDLLPYLKKSHSLGCFPGLKSGFGYMSIITYMKGNGDDVKIIHVNLLALAILRCFFDDSLEDESDISKLIKEYYDSTISLN